MDQVIATLPDGWQFVLGAIIVLGILFRRRGTSNKDPKRAFDSEQRRKGFALASSQCEMSTPWMTRCTATASHADHFYPHAKGGASSMMNLVAACAPHNLSKGAKLPSAVDRALISARRRNYFPADLERKPGEWYRGV
ncbi:HNH endonuclease [Leucobacter sp. cx-169]|uniref:HNH endonuclease n=1 Tax=Leucobacter sp. cx-169 TaxID=2770549 RepID=UPI00165E49C2|nr:HNH endonuclease signature motif containing protein [Leucobacter sp. cx-169]MBC9927275.1 HNH endonuclease [Leucobacter sp. cx-169]